MLTIVVLATYVVASITYVYRWRGRARYPGFSQYLRKSWPVFAPLNCLLYLATHRFARQPVLDAGYLEGISLLRAQWPQIRDEALALQRAGELEATSMPASAGYHDLGFRTFYKRGWKKFYLQWYGAPHPSARRLCPATVQLLEQLPCIRAALFTVLPAGSELSLHSDPLACSLRYHLGLQTPNSERCFICVDGQRLSWRDGEDFVFDETYPHYAMNASDSARLILMCDVERPMHGAGRAFNRLYTRLAAALAVPNTVEDRQGLITAMFARVTPWRNAALTLKATHRGSYRLLKLAFNIALVVVAFSLLYAALQLVTYADRLALQ